MFMRRLHENGALEVVEVVLSLIIIALIAWEIRIGYDSMKASSEELDLLQQQVSSLHQSSETLAGATDVLKRQLDIISSEQEQQIAEKARAPRLEVTVAGLPLDGRSSRQFPSQEFTASHAIWEVRLVNKATATAHTGFLRIWSDNKDVSLGCIGPTTSGTEADPLVAHSDHVAFVTIQQLPPGTWLPVQLSALYPPSVAEFTVNFNAKAVGYPPRGVGSMRVKPPAKP
jgi:cell division protein FtsB